MPLESRFSQVLSCPSSRMEDQPLWRGIHSVIVPTLGMIVPNWFLIIPELHTFNFAQQTLAAREELAVLAATITDAVAVSGDELLVFEHGARHAGSAVGCGLDHAHLHLVVAPSALVNTIWSAMEGDLEAEQKETALDGLYQSIDAEQPYYMAWRSGRRVLEQPARQEVSQRFRRIIAAAAGVPDQWNYREHPFHDNISNTIAAVRHRKPLAA